MIDITKAVHENVAKQEVAEYSPTLAALAELEATYGTEVPDASNRDGYNRCKQIAGECQKLRTGLESTRKEKKKPYLDMSRLIDSQAKEITVRLAAIETPFRDAYRAVDAEKKRIKEERQARILELNSMTTWAVGKTPEEIGAKMEEVQDTEIDKSTFGNLVDDAAAAVGNAMEQLTQAHVAAVNARAEEERRLAEQAELEALRKEKEEREAKERQEREAKEAAEEEARRQREIAEAEKRAREQAEKEAAEREERMKREQDEREDRLKREADERARQAKEQAEREAREKAEAEEAELQRREANKRHASNICRQAKEDIIALGVDEDTANRIVKAIAAKGISNVQINF